MAGDMVDPRPRPSLWKAPLSATAKFMTFYDKMQDLSSPGNNVTCQFQVSLRPNMDRVQLSPLVLYYMEDSEGEGREKVCLWRVCESGPWPPLKL